jgi:membrane protein required for colicin V production
MNWVDYIIISVIILSMGIGLLRGFFREALSLATWALALVLSLKYASVLSNLSNSFVTVDSVRIIICFLVVFITTFICSSIFSKLMTSLIDKNGLSGINRVFGLLFGFGRGLAMVGLAVFLVGSTTQFLSSDDWAAARFSNTSVLMVKRALDWSPSKFETNYNF